LSVCVCVCVAVCASFFLTHPFRHPIIIPSFSSLLLLCFFPPRTPHDF
jgi:hypothetical protein